MAKNDESDKIEKLSKLVELILLDMQNSKILDDKIVKWYIFYMKQNGLI